MARATAPVVMSPQWSRCGPISIMSPSFMVAHLGGLCPLFGREDRLHVQPDRAPCQDQVEPGGGGPVVEGPEPRLGGARVLEGAAEVDAGMLHRIPPLDQFRPVLGTDGLDADLLGLGQLQVPADPLGSVARVRSRLG